MKIIISRSMHYSNFNEEQAQNFKQWFGKSVVKDKKTKQPSICYHGTTADIKFFDIKYLGHGNDQSGIGFYFSSSPTDADYYNGQTGSTFPVYLRIEKPIDFDNQPRISATVIKKIIDKADKAYVKQFMEDNVGLDRGLVPAINQYVGWMVGMDMVRASFSIYNDLFDGTTKQPEFSNIFMKASGRDGIIRKMGTDSIHYIVFSPNQIKSAVGNNGNFTLSNQDIAK